MPLNRLLTRPAQSDKRQLSDKLTTLFRTLNWGERAKKNASKNDPKHVIFRKDETVLTRTDLARER